MYATGNGTRNGRDRGNDRGKEWADANLLREQVAGAGRMNAAQLLLAGDPGATALIEDDVELSYAELRARVMQSAAAWRQRGVRPGERCVIAILDGLDWVAAFLGLIWTGGLPIVISPKATPAQLHDLVSDSGAVALLLEDESALGFGAARAIARSAWRAELQAGDGGEGERLRVEADEDAPAFLLYSSGTTGKPKGIVHAHRAVRDAHVFARDILGATAQDRFYSTSKLFFAYPLANALFAGLRLGASVVLDARWPNPQQVGAAARRHRATLLFSVPTLYRRMVEAQVQFPSVRVAVSAGEACPPALAEEWREQTGLSLVNGYGTTETLSLVLYRMSHMTGSVATPLTNIVVDKSDPVAGGAVRLWFAHPAVSLGYTRVVSHDSARFGEPGFSPGDLFRPVGDAEGWNFAGRSDQLLKVFGRWVDTLAVEQALLETLQAQVRELCVVPSGTGNEHISCLHLFVVPGTGDEAALPAAIAAAIARLPVYQQPSEVHYVWEFPRTETGKLRRNELTASVG